jgi:hypothetical protein
MILLGDMVAATVSSLCKIIVYRAVKVAAAPP